MNANSKEYWNRNFPKAQAWLLAHRFYWCGQGEDTGFYFMTVVDKPLHAPCVQAAFDDYDFDGSSPPFWMSDNCCDTDTVYLDDPTDDKIIQYMEEHLERVTNATRALASKSGPRTSISHQADSEGAGSPTPDDLLLDAQCGQSVAYQNRGVE